MNRRLCVMFTALLSLSSGCSSGLVHTRAFTADSRYLVWQDLHYFPPIFNWEVKCTDCQTGATRLLGKGDFVLDSSSTYAVLRPACDWPGEIMLVRLEDGRARKVVVQPSDLGFYGPEWLDVTVASFDPPEVHALLVSNADRKFRRCRLGNEVWTVVEEGPADAVMLDRARAIGEQSAFMYDQVKTKVKNTASPNGECVLTESMAAPAHRSELRIGKRVVLLGVQTDQLADMLNAIGEFLVYGGK